MLVGIPKEQKTLEKRVAITPDGAKELINLGHKVLIQRDAGLGSFFSNEEYLLAGCKIVDTPEEIWNCDLVVKVKEPQEEEFKFLSENTQLFTYLHLASEPEVTKALLECKTTSIAYELISDSSGLLPLLQPMSEIAGKLAVINGSFYLLAPQEGRGLLLGGSTGVERGRVVILGGGAAGAAACEVALGMGANVVILERNRQRMELLKARFGNQVDLIYSTQSSIERYAVDADLLIGAILIPGASAPKLVTKEIVSKMKKGSVIIDISIDQGGCVETIRTTSLKEPTFIDMGVVHYGVGNMPAQTPRTSTMALTSVTLPYICMIADKRWTPEIKAAVNTHKGKLTNAAVGSSLGIPVYELKDTEI
jgi:alanine dehydrogenase